MAKAGTLVFPPGARSGSISIPLYPVAPSTPAKAFYLIFAKPVNAALNVPQATASILVNNGPLVIVQAQVQPDGRFQLMVNGGVSGQSYALFASTNLTYWVPIGNFRDTNQPVILYDSNSSKYGERFYRLGP